MEERKLFAIWQDNVVKGYIALTEEQKNAINSIQNVGLYIGTDIYTKEAQA